MNVMVIGGGASGMMAALTASQSGEHHVLLLERQARIGRKLLATGNGRCNLTNQNASPAYYHGEEVSFCSYALGTFGVQETLDFFASLGLLTVAEENGRVYPFSDSANSVLDVLRLNLEQRDNVEIITASEITSLKRKNGIFAAIAGEATYRADRVIVCTGGVAGGKLGGTDLGYKLLASFGHTRTKLYPSLVQIKTDTTLVRSLKGVRTQAVIRYGREERRGEIQFTDYGVSGPAVFELSRSVSVGGGKGTLLIDLLPEISEQALYEMLRQRCGALPELKAEELLTGILHNRLGRTIIRACDLRFDDSCNAVSGSVLRRISHMVKFFALSVQGVMGMDLAQVTAGGIRTAEFHERTMESKLCPGLYACGEVLDIDGDCGGYNLQWAWSSGHLAGELREKE